MAYAQMLRELFPEITLTWEDLLLLESFQVKYLQDRIAVQEFATLLRTHPVLQRFLIAKDPHIRKFLSTLLEENNPVEDVNLIERHCQDALWEIGDLIIYNKHPEHFDANAPVNWEIGEISSITSLEGKIVADVGAGSGRIAFLVSAVVQNIYAIEPLSGFRTYMKEKAVESGVDNMFIMDGTLNSIPLPADSLDVLITSNSIGWNLEEELKEIERVVRPGGHAIHLLQSQEETKDPYQKVLSSSPWNYSRLEDGKKKGMKLRYYKEI